MVNLKKPSTETIASQPLLLEMLVYFYDAIRELQKLVRPTLVTSIIDLGALGEDPPIPAVGQVYIYTIAGVLKARTRVTVTVLAP